MKTKFFLVAALIALSSLPSKAQFVVTDPTNLAQSIVNTTRNVVETSTTASNMTRKIMYDRMIPPYGVEVTFDKTLHIIFPSAVKYIDLGSANIIAGIADGSDNVVRVKAAVKGFETETNFSVITDEGSFYTFNVKYADEPQKLNVEMKDFIHDKICGNERSRFCSIMSMSFRQKKGYKSPSLAKL